MAFSPLTSPLRHNDCMRQPVLIVVGGLPATGKTTVARHVARELRAAYVRIDSIETAITRAEGRHEVTNGWDDPPGYLVGYEIAADQLRAGLDVIAESVNPLQITRDAWRETGLQAGARVVEVEFICSDALEHRRRVEERVLDIEDLKRPTWDEVINREYHPWSRERVVVDTAILGAEDAAHLIRTNTPGGLAAGRHDNFQSFATRTRPSTV